MYIHIRFIQHGFVTLIPNVKRSIMLLEKVTPAGSETLGADACSLTSRSTCPDAPRRYSATAVGCAIDASILAGVAALVRPQDGFPPFARAGCRRPTQIFMPYDLFPSPPSAEGIRPLEALCPSDASHTSHAAAVKNPEFNR